MTIGISWKKIIAGTLAVLVVAGTVPANVGFNKLLVNKVIVASAEAPVLVADVQFDKTELTM